MIAGHRAFVRTAPSRSSGRQDIGAALGSNRLVHDRRISKRLLLAMNFCNILVFCTDDPLRTPDDIAIAGHNPAPSG